MPVGEFVKRIFTTNPAQAEALVHASFIEALEGQDSQDRLDAQRLIDWYQRKDTEIVEHLKERARRSFDSITDWQLPVINGVPRTIRRLSTAYKEPPKREYLKGDKVLEGGSAQMKLIDQMLSAVDLDRKMRSADRLSTLLNTMHIEVVFRRGAIDYDVRLRPSVTVIPDPEDFLELSKFATQWNPLNPDDLEPVQGWIYWTDELHAFISKDGRFIGLSNEEGTNPYRDRDDEPVIPIVTVRKLEDIDDYWGALGADLVNGFEVTTVQLGNMWETMTLQTHGQPLFINVKLPGGAKIKWGPKHPLVAMNIQKDDVPPDVKFPKPDPDFDEVRDVLDWYIKQIAASYGLPPSAWSLDEQRLSGFAKFMDNIELIETRKEDATQWQKIESDLFAKSVVVWNERSAEGTIDQEIELRVTFPEQKVPETPTEKHTRWTIAIGAGLRSPVDFFMEEEGLNAEDALKRALEVAAANKRIRKASGSEPTEALPPEPVTAGGGGTEEGED